MHGHSIVVPVESLNNYRRGHDKSLPAIVSCDAINGGIASGTPVLGCYTRSVGSPKADRANQRVDNRQGSSRPNSSRLFHVPGKPIGISTANM